MNWKTKYLNDSALGIPIISKHHVLNFEVKLFLKLEFNTLCISKCRNIAEFSGWQFTWALNTVYMLATLKLICPALSSLLNPL